MRAPLRIAKRYTLMGNAFIRFETPDGRATDVKVRDRSDNGVDRLSTWQARQQAVRTLGITVPCPNGCGRRVVYGVYIDPSVACPT